MIVFHRKNDKNELKIYRKNDKTIAYVIKKQYLCSGF